MTEFEEEAQEYQELRQQALKKITQEMAALRYRHAKLEGWVDAIKSGRATDEQLRRLLAY
jgi:hypothetical protein